MDICEKQGVTNFTTCKHAIDTQKADFDGDNCGQQVHLRKDMPSLTQSIVNELYIENILSEEAITNDTDLQKAFKNYFRFTFLEDWVGDNTNALARDLDEKIQQCDAIDQNDSYKWIVMDI